jgi:hypothetical protein
LGLFPDEQAEWPSIVLKVHSVRLQYTEATMLTIIRPIDPVFYMVGCMWT